MPKFFRTAVPCLLAFVCLIHLAMVPACGNPPVRAKHKPQISISIHGPMAEDTAMRDYGLVAGTIATGVVRINIGSEVYKNPLPQTDGSIWPEELVIHTGDYNGEEHPEWLTEMRLQPVRWSHKKPKFERYSFMFTVPRSAAGHWLTFSATYEHPILGHLETFHPDGHLVTLVPPDEEMDAFVFSRLRIYRDLLKDSLRTLALADSFIALGHRGYSCLEAAMLLAYSLKNYEAALRYMELNMEANGYFNSRMAGHVPEGICKEEARRIRAEKNEKYYQQVRQRWLQLIEEQKQQQQR
jgi:hypothetical protein